MKICENGVFGAEHFWIKSVNSLISAHISPGCRSRSIATNSCSCQNIHLPKLTWNPQKLVVSTSIDLSPFLFGGISGSSWGVPRALHLSHYCYCWIPIQKLIRNPTFAIKNCNKWEIRSINLPCFQHSPSNSCRTICFSQ